jgi:murein DD-endopeptidase MepM/ murein hydrolase activator NlpD
MDAATVDLPLRGEWWTPNTPGSCVPGHGTDLRPLTGNHVIVESGHGFVVHAHAKTGSVTVLRGERIEADRQIAAVGHSGDATAPHLHFQLMDDLDPRRARGILCRFREYEMLDHGVWRTVRDGIPVRTERLRRP